MSIASIPAIPTNAANKANDVKAADAKWIIEWLKNKIINKKIIR
jgi:hypothetical protein